MAEAFGKELCDSWSNLPSEILSLIQSYTTREREYNILRFICKSWRCIFTLHRQSPFPINDHYGLRSYPLLMSSEGCKYNFFHPLHHTYYMQIPELSKKKIIYSKDGWLLVKSGTVRQDKQIFFFNPLTKIRIDLPDLPFYHEFEKFSFSGLPTSKDYVVVGIGSPYYFHDVEIGVIKFGDENWEVDTIEFEENEGNHRDKFHISSNPVFVDGYCYCLSIDGKVGIFDPDDVINTWEVIGKPLRRPQCFSRSLMQSFMVESDDELLAIFLTNDGRVSIYKLDQFELDWVKVEDLDDKVIYLSNAASWVEKGISKNKIYFPLFYSDKALVFYNLSTGRYQSNGYNFSRSNFFDMKYLPHSSWIKITLHVF